MSIYSTVLIIGGTSGIGEALVKNIHAQGKTVIATGRRQEKLSTLETELPGLKTSAFDFSDIANLPSRTETLFENYPDIDTVIINAGIQSLLLFIEGESSPEAISKEVTTNLTAPIVLSQTLVRIFLKKPKPCSIILVSSGLAFVPLPVFPIYTPTKAALHTFAIALRSQVAGTNIKVIELIPPYVETNLDTTFRDKLMTIMGGPDAPKAMLLKDFIEEAMEKLDKKVDGEPINEVAIGDFPKNAATAWRTAFGPFLKAFHVVG